MCICLIAFKLNISKKGENIISSFSCAGNGTVDRDICDNEVHHPALLCSLLAKVCMSHEKAKGPIKKQSATNITDDD